MQSVSSRIWTRIAVSISCEDNHYTTGTYRQSCARPEHRTTCFLVALLPVILSLLVSVGYMISETLTQILVVTPPTYGLHIDTSPSSMLPTQFSGTPAGEQPASCLFYVTDVLPVMPPKQFMLHVKGIFLSISNNIIISKSGWFYTGLYHFKHIGYII